MHHRLSRPLLRTTQRQVPSLCRYYSAPTDGIPPAKQRFIPDRETFQAPKGFLLGTTYAGVKASNKTKDDICVIISEEPCEAVLYVTRNAFRAAPVSVSRAIVNNLPDEGSGARGVIINSGCANAVTGKDGIHHAIKMGRAVDDLFPASEPPPIGEGGLTGPAKATLESAGVSGVDGHRTLVMSTGVIGQKLPIEKILDAVPTVTANMANDYDSWMSAANAIMTTDTFPKLVSHQFSLPSDPGTTYTVAGITKGAGMIHPNMGTLLAVVCTDLSIHNNLLRQIADKALRNSFNSISIDGDTSTNDSLAIFANGAQKPSAEKVKHVSDEDHAAIQEALSKIMTDLAKLVVRDGEGATKFITIEVYEPKRAAGAKPLMRARRIAKGIATSSLVKTAMYGRDANWGRILCAIGYTDRYVNTEELSVRLATPTPNGEGKDVLDVVVNGEPVEIDEAKASAMLQQEDIDIIVDMGPRPPDPPKGRVVTYWTCDFSHEYVTINGDYRT